MEKLVNTVAKLREKTGQRRDEISQLLSISPGVKDPRSDCLHMVFNHATLTLELLDCYHHKVIKLPTGVGKEYTERMQKQNAERCVMILKWMFIASLSSIEYSAKASVASYPVNSPAKDLMKVKKGQYVYLRDIMRNSRKDSSLIDDDAYKDWQNLIDLRNCIVHNNAYSDTDKTIDIGGTKITATAGGMFKGNLDDFAILTEVAIERYLAWVKALIKEYGR